jgi:hypothetical protein
MFSFLILSSLRSESYRVMAARLRSPFSGIRSTADCHQDLTAHSDALDERKHQQRTETEKPRNLWGK